MASRKPEYLGEPTLGQVMRRPQWILALLFALVVAAVFAWLGQWQMGNAIRDNVDELERTEEVRSLDDLTEPIAGVPEVAAGAVVSLDGSFVSGDYVIVSERMNRGLSDASGNAAAGDDETAERAEGVWIVGHVQRGSAGDGADTSGAGPASLAVAIGWAESESEARAAIDALDALPEDTLNIEGRYLPAEAPDLPRPSDDPHVMRTMVPAYLANVWNTVPEGPIYGGYLVLHDESDGAALLETAGLTAIDSVAPSPPERVSWLNVFYAIEWVIFAAIALYLWYRLARDAWEKEHELKLLMEAEAAKNDTPNEP